MKEKIKNNKILVSVTALFIIVASIVAVNIITDKSDNIQTATGTSNSSELEIIDESSYEPTSTPEITTETKVDEDVIDDDLVVNTENENVTIEEDKNGNQIAIIKDDNGEEVKVAVKKDENGKTVVDTTKKIVTDKDNNYVVKDNSETSDGNTESTTTVDPKTHKVVVKETTPAETKTTTNDSSSESNKTTTKTTTKSTTTTTAKPTTTAKTTEAPKTTTTKTTTTKKTTTDKSQYPDYEVDPIHEDPVETATTTTKVTTTPKVTAAPKTTTTTTAKKTEESKTTTTVCIHANMQPVYREETIPAWDETVTVKKTSFECHGCGLLYCDVEDAWNNKDEATLKKLFLTDITNQKIIDNVNKYSLLNAYSDAYDCYTSHCTVCHGGSSWGTATVKRNEIIHHDVETTLIIDHYYCPDCKKDIY